MKRGTILSDDHQHPDKSLPGGSRGKVVTGTLLLTGSRVVFFACGYLVQVFLARQLQPAMYGVWGLVLGFLTIYRMLLMSGSTMAISKFVAQQTEHARAIRNQGLKLQLVFSGVLCVILGLSASFIARLLKDMTLAPYIRATLVFIPVYAIYAVYLGGLNGLRAFKQQAQVSVTYSVVRMVGVVGFVFLGFQVYGILGGSLIGVIVATVLAHYSYTFPSTDQRVAWQPIVRFALPVSLISLASTIFNHLNVFLIKALLERDELVGFYTVATTLAQMPYMLLLGLNSVLFPVVVHSLTDRDSHQTTFYITRSLRYSLLVLIPVTFLTAATSKGLISLIYTARYAAAADPLRILIFGSMFMFFSSLATTIMMAMGKLQIIAAIVVLRIGLGFGLNYVLIPVYGLNGAALGISVVSFMSALAGLVYISRRFGRLIDPLSLTKIIGAAAVTALPCLMYEFTGFWLVIGWAVLLSVYGLLLVLLKEIGQEEWLTLKRAIIPRAVK